MSKVRITGIVVVVVLLGLGVLFFNQKNKIKTVSCSSPQISDLSSVANYEAVKGMSLQCANFEEQKLQTTFDPNNSLTWDNAFPSRENWVKRLKVFKSAIDNNNGWATYTNKKYGFEFDYPKDWNVFVANNGLEIVLSNPGDQLVRPMVIKIHAYAKASNNQNDWIDNKGVIELTKIGLMQKKKELEKSYQSGRYGKFVKLDSNYSTFDYHNFYHSGEFFIGNNLITVTQPLSVIAPDVAGWGQIQDSILSKIKNNSVNELVSSEIKFTDLVVDSFYPLSLWAGSGK